MGASASVIQEYYKAVDYWADIVGNRDWKLSVWIVGQNDVDLVVLTYIMQNRKVLSMQE